jgi:nickel-dependent lactate racemase
MGYIVPYSEGILSFDLPLGMRGALIESAPMHPGADAAVLARDALAHPVESSSIAELVASTRAKRACIAFTDTSRACPDHLLVPAILEQLTSAGLSPGAITLMCAVGLHRPLTRSEMKAKLGIEVVDRYQIFNHDAQDAARLAYLGETLDGTPLVVNREAAEADLLIATGVVEPHNFAGYSGGAKTIVIGCGGEETIAATHNVSMIDRPGVRLGRVEDNPFQAVMRAGGKAAGLNFTLNVVLNGAGEVLAACAGSPNVVHDRLISLAQSVYEVPIERQFDVAIAGAGGTKDANIYQATRAATYLHYAPTPVVRPGGIIIVPARCPEGAGLGVGELRFHEALRDAVDVKTLVAELQEKGYPPGVQRTYMVARTLCDVEVVVAGALYPEAVRECKMTPVDTIEEGLTFAQRKLGDELDVIVVPHALQTLPVIRKESSERSI